MPHETSDPDAIDTVRAFSRLYTRRIGVLREHLYGTGQTLTQARVLYELNAQGTARAAELARQLGLDPAHLSRLLAGFLRDGLIAQAPAPDDGRAQLVRLTPAGHDLAETLAERSRDEISRMLEMLGPLAAGRLAGALREASLALAPRPEASAPHGPVVRAAETGDIGWIVHRHGVLYAREYGWDATFEGLVAEIAGRYLQSHDPTREGAWVADDGGQVLGSAFLMDAGGGTGKLRLVYVEPTARGLGLGRALVGATIERARAVGYRRMTLWTQSCLTAACGLYRSLGFVLTGEERHRSFGADLVGQTFDLDLAPTA